MTQYRYLCEPLPQHSRKEPVYLIPPWPHAWPYFSNEWARDWERVWVPTAAEPILVFRTHSPQELVLFSLFLQPIQFQLFPILCSPWGGKVKTNSGAVVTQRQIGSGRCSPDPLYCTVPCHSLMQILAKYREQRCGFIIEHFDSDPDLSCHVEADSDHRLNLAPKCNKKLFGWKIQKVKN